MHVSALLRQYNLRPRKGMGQHFLVNADILERIADAARLTPDDVVVEVGPGLGSLTAVLARRAGHVLAIELDRDLVAALHSILASYANVRVVQGDILDVSLPDELAATSAGDDPKYKVVANLPYYITTPVVRYFFGQCHRPSLLVVAVQEEVARRMTATPPNTNFLAVLVQFYGRPDIVAHIPAGAFYPRPKVDSAAVRIEVASRLPLPVHEIDGFFAMISAGFSQPRKQVHNPLAQGLGVPREDILAALRGAGIDEKRRAETLSLEEWLRLYRQLRK